MNRLPPAGIWNRRPTAGAVALAALAVLTGWAMYVPDGLLGKADAVGYAVCHRIDLRSFHLGGRAVSFCARCTGMYLGAVLGLAFLAVRAPGRGGLPSRRVIAVLGVLAAAFVVDGLNSFSNLVPGFPSLYTTTNTLRVITGTGFGIAMAAFVYPAFNQTVWRSWDPAPALGGLRELTPLLGLGAATVLAVLSENPLILYPASLLSAAGVVLLLTMIYTMVVLTLLQHENAFLGPRALALPLLAGFTLAMLQITGADLVRFWLTGTWEGFHFG